MIEQSWQNTYIVEGVTHPAGSRSPKEPNSFVKLCREHSDCASAEQPGTLAGHMGWVARGEQEPAMEEASFAPGIRWNLMGSDGVWWDLMEHGNLEDVTGWEFLVADR